MEDFQINTSIKFPGLRSTWFLFIPLVVWCILVFGFDFNGLYGQDAHEYYRYGNAITRFILTGAHPGDYFWPLMYPIIGGIAGLILPSVFAMQVISLLAFGGCIYYLKKLLTLFYGAHDREQWLYITLSFGISPFVLRSAAVIMSDMTASFFTLAAFYHFIKFNDNRSGKTFVMSILFTALAFHSRYATAVVLIIPMIYAFILWLKKPQWLSLIYAVMLAAIVSLPHFLVRTSDAGEFIHHNWIKDWSIHHFPGYSFQTPDGAVSYDLPNLLYAFIHCFHPGYFLMILVLIPYFRRLLLKPVPVLLAFTSVIIYSLFLAGIPFQNKRFLLISFPMVIAFFYPAWRGFYAMLYRKRMIGGVTLLLCLIQLAMFIRAISPAYRLNKLEKQVASALSVYPQQKIYAFDMDVALKTYLPDRDWNNLWEKEYRTFEKGSLVLFNEPKFSMQWKGMNPMLNWKRLNEQNELELLRTFDSDWKLYEIR